MFFDFQFTVNRKNFTKKKNSALLKFIVDSKNSKSDLNNTLKALDVSINKLQQENFLDKDGKDLWNYNDNSSPDLLVLQKIKLDDKFNSDYFRNYFAGLVPKLKGKNIKNLQIDLPDYSNYDKYFEEEKYFYQTIIEGIYLGNYTFDVYKSDKKTPPKVTVNFNSSNSGVMKKVIQDSAALMEAVYFARDLTSEPAITLTPNELAKRTRKELQSAKVKVSVLSRKELEKRKMGAILAVGDASTNDPLLLTIHYKPNKKSKKKIALVGKGVTYDAGGLSIKPTDSMLDMYADMAGASTVIGTIKAAAALNLPVEIYGIIPAVENMISGNSFKPGDIISTASGKTIEVRNTDAEGRIILADALEYASKLKPDEIIDFATLTGAILVALGEFTAGLFTANDTLAENLSASSKATYERIWRMPFGAEYNSMVESKIADVSNLGPRWGGAISAGKFLENFVDKNIPWAHIDIAGCAVKHKLNNYTEKYNTGFGVRLMIDYLSKL